jgi:hypothetical protein
MSGRVAGPIEPMDILIGLIVAVLTAAPAATIDSGQAPSQSEAHDAVALGRTRDPAQYDAFHAGYVLSPSGEVERVEVITEFRRAVLIVRQHAEMGEYSFNENNLARALVPYRGLVTFTAQLRLHPLHNYATPPGYEMYVQTGPTTKPIAPSSFKREPVYPPGRPDTPPAMSGFVLILTVPRADISGAADPALVIVNEASDVVWRARLDLSRFR